MKKVNLYIILLCSLSLSLLISCDPSTDGPKSEFANGVLIVNEGNFTPADGSVSHLDLATTKVQASIFESKNKGEKLGVIESMTLDGDQAYIVLNNGDKVQIVNSNTFKDEGTIKSEGMIAPRYMAVVNGKGYLTVWGPYAPDFSLIDSYILVLDLKSKTVTDTIDTNEGSENIILYNNMLYVSNSSANTVQVIDPTKTKDQIVKTIEVGTSPGGFVIDSGNNLWTICSGGYNDGVDGSLYKINPSTYETEKSLPLGMKVSSKLTINSEKNKMFYFSGNTIYAISTTATEAPAEPIITEATSVNFYGIGYDVKNNILYAGDAADFSKSGNVFRYKGDGTAIDNFSSEGTSPNGFIFR